MHGHKILPGSSKFVIEEVLNTWDAYDEDLHGEGTFVQWPLHSAVQPNDESHASKLSKWFDGDGIMTGNAQTFLELGLKRGKKKTRNPKLWKQAIAKEYRYQGYQRKMKPLKNCRKKCATNFTEEERQTCHDAFWSLGSATRQWDFLNSCLKFVPTKRHRPRKGGQKRPNNLQRYINEKEICKACFELTLDISEQMMKTVISKRNENGVVTRDNRGKFGVKTSFKDGVITHIKMFPVRDTHYCRKETNRRWLHEKMSIPKMYDLYQVYCKEKDINACSINYYRHIFNTQFNLSFFQLKKDQCQQCENFENEIKSKSKKRECFRKRDNFKEMDLPDLKEVETRKEESDEEEEEQHEGGGEAKECTIVRTEDEIVKDYIHHIKEVEITRKLKMQKKVNSAHSRGTLMCAHFDLQQVFDCPNTNVGEVYYKRLLSVYNFVVVDVTGEERNEEGHCFVWDERNGNRGTNEIGSALWKFCVEASQRGVTQIDFFCDNCGGQNRNTLIAALIHHIVQATKINQITITFLVKGHTENSADTVHSIIERNRSTAKIFLPYEWATVIRSAPTEKIDLNVHELTFKDFFDLKELSARYKNFRLDCYGEVALNWVKVSAIQVNKGSHMLKYKRWNSDDYSQLNMMQVGKGRRKDKVYTMTPMRPAYREELPIATAKYEDLMDLCNPQKQVIPRAYHHFYQNLKHQ